MLLVSDQGSMFKPMPLGGIGRKLSVDLEDGNTASLERLLLFILLARLVALLGFELAIGPAFGGRLDVYDAQQGSPARLAGQYEGYTGQMQQVEPAEAVCEVCCDDGADGRSLGERVPRKVLLAQDPDAEVFAGAIRVEGIQTCVDGCGLGDDAAEPDGRDKQRQPGRYYRGRVAWVDGHDVLGVSARVKSSDATDEQCCEASCS